MANKLDVAIAYRRGLEDGVKLGVDAIKALTEAIGEVSEGMAGADPMSPEQTLREVWARMTEVVEKLEARRIEAAR